MGKVISTRGLMGSSGVRFGTSGVRGLAEDMTDEVCYAYTTAFIQYLEKSGRISPGSAIAVGGDLRASTERIMKAVSKAVYDKGYQPENCGRLPSPALAYYGFTSRIPTAMVTGSHIPEDRNGIKYTLCEGELLKRHEQEIKEQEILVPDGLFNEEGGFTTETSLGPPRDNAIKGYMERYLDFFPKNCLSGKKVGVYEHSAVSRELMKKILSHLGARVNGLGYSDTFIPVDTEAIRPEDEEAAKEWIKEYSLDTLISSDGDGDRPLVSDEQGNWLRGDVAGILCAAYLGADAVVTPVSCNTAAERCGLFQKVYRTRIGSPYVIEGMMQAVEDGFKRVAGYEANGGFLLGSDFNETHKTLSALPTRDAVIVHIALLLFSISKSKGIGQLVAELPQRYTYSNRLKDFPSEKSTAKLEELYPGGVKDTSPIEAVLGRYFGRPAGIDTTDGLRITFESGEIVHLRPSGNAPEFRCYNEADSQARAKEMNRICLEIMNTWR